MADETTDLAPTDDIATAIVGLGKYEPPMGSAEMAAVDIVKRILDATDASEVSDAAGGQTIAAADVLGTPFVLKGVRFNPSTVDGAEGSPTVYALVDAVDANGEPVLITTGARTALAQLLKLDELGAFPTKNPWRFTQSDRPTGGGFYPVWLVEDRP